MNIPSTNISNPSMLNPHLVNYRMDLFTPQPIQIPYQNQPHQGSQQHQAVLRQHQGFQNQYQDQYLQH